MLSRRSLPSFPPWTASAPPSSAGAVDPRSTSPLFSCSWLRGVQFCNRRAASGDSSSTLSPQFVLPFHGPLPVATSRRPVDGSTTTPARAQIAESLAPQELGSINTWRLLQREFHTCTIAPFDGLSVTT
jgi:hypothetical protein